MNKQIDIRTQGSRLTATFFKTENKDTLKLKIWLEVPQPTISVNVTSYRHALYIKKYRARNYEFLFLNNYEKLKEYISEQDLYDAMHNHWDTINPLKRFVTGTTNGVATGFTVEKRENRIIKDEYSL